MYSTRLVPQKAIVSSTRPYVNCRHTSLTTVVMLYGLLMMLANGIVSKVTVLSSSVNNATIASPCSTIMFYYIFIADTTTHLHLDIVPNFSCRLSEYCPTVSQHIPLFERLKYSVHTFARHCLRHDLPNTLNITCELVKGKIDTHSLSGFTNYAKHQIIQNYELTCNITRCYICSHDVR